jgi:hypothetical protein
MTEVACFQGEWCYTGWGQQQSNGAVSIAVCDWWRNIFEILWNLILCEIQRAIALMPEVHIHVCLDS